MAGAIAFGVAAQPCFSGAAFGADANMGATVAQLGTTHFTASELSDFVRSLQPDVRQQALSNPQVMKQLVQLQVIRKALLNDAVARKWQQTPDVARQIDEARDAIVLKTYLASVVALPDNYPSEAEIQTAYDLNRDSFLMPRQYRLQQIFIASPQDDRNGAAAQKKAEDIARQARMPGAKFDAFARANSQHEPSASKGGDMGWAVEAQILPEVRAKIAGMSLGEVSDPIRSAVGWHIVRLLDTKPAAPRPLQEVRASLIGALRERKLKEGEQYYIVRMLQKTPPVLNEPQLRKIFEATR